MMVLVKYDKDVLSNNTFDMTSLDKTFSDIIVSNFHNLYQSQKALSDIRRFDMKLSDLSLDSRAYKSPKNKNQRRYTVEFDFEYISTNMRHVYRKSDLYDMFIDQFTISSRQDLFRYNFIVFIDGNYVNSCEILPYNGKTILSLNGARGINSIGIPYEKYYDLVQRNADITIFFIPNLTVSSLDTNIHMINKYSDGLDVSKGTNTDSIGDMSVCFCSCCENKSLSYGIDFYKPDINKVVLDFKSHLLSSPIVNLNWVNFNTNTFSSVEANRNQPYFQLNTEVPVPIENMIILSVGKDNVMRFNHKLSIHLYYPNIYEVQGLSQDESVIIYYSYNTQVCSDREHYTDELKLYHDYTNDIIDRYNLDNIPDFIKDYSPIELNYSIEDYNESVHIPNVISYKINTLQEYIDRDPDILIKYLTYQLGKSNKFYIDMSKLDLKSKIRTSTVEELPNDIINFDKPHYLFILRTNFLKGTNYKMDVYLDGIYLYTDKYLILSDNDFFYIYIPVDMTTKNSMVELNRYPINTFEKPIYIGSKDTPIEVSYSELDNRECIFNDFILVDEYKNYIPKSSYKFDMVIDGINHIFKSTSYKKVTGDFRIIIIDDTLVSRSITLLLNNLPSSIEVDFEPSDKYYKVISDISRSNNRKENYKIIANGRTAPREYFSMYESLSHMGEVKLNIKFIPKEEHNRVSVNFSRDNFKTVYFKETIDESGFIDLTARIDKPINLKWYDIYLDGVKLHKNNIRIISATKFIIHNVKSNRNLEVVENSREYEVLRLNRNNYSINDKIWDNIEEIRDKILSEYGDIETTIEDIFGELVSDVTSERMDFFEYMLRFTYINANLRQITQDVKNRYSKIVNPDGSVFIDANITKDAKIIYEINTNKEGGIFMNNDQINRSTEIGGQTDRFALGALYKSNKARALPGELMCDPNTGGSLLRREDGTIISSDEINRLNSHIEKAYANSIYLGYINKDIISVEFDTIDLPQVIELDTDILVEGEFELQNLSECFMLSLDVDTTTVVDNVVVKTDIVPNVIITYKEGSITKTVEIPTSHLLTTPIKVDRNSITIKSVTIKLDDSVTEKVEVTLHSILLIQ